MGSAICVRQTELAELGMSSIPTLFPVPKVQEAFTEDGTPTNEASYRYVAGFLNEFEWYARALKEARAKGLPD